MQALLDRRMRLFKLVADQSATGLPRTGHARLVGICRAASQVLHASGVGVTIMSTAGWRGVVAATGSAGEELEDLQTVCGEGPCLDAFRSGRPVLVDDLHDATWAGWTGYAPLAQAAGVRAVFAFPLQVGATRIGVLDIYRDRAGSLTADEYADASVLADLMLGTLLDGEPAPDAYLMTHAVEESLDYRIYQAQGMVGAQLDVGPAEAMSRLRAYALAHDRRLSDVVADVLSGNLSWEIERRD